MQGLMQDRPLLISSLIEHAAARHGATEVVSRTIEGPIHRSDYAEVQRRAKRVAHALARLAVAPGERVATLAWNTHRHLELYYGVSGSGRVLHTVNPRLFPEQISYIVNHAEDRVLCFDVCFAPLVEKLAPLLRSVKTYVAMTGREHVPKMGGLNVLCYEDWIGKESDSYEWPQFDERLASSMCYTSGTTGNPKGVVYSHRSTLIHTLVQCQPEAQNLAPSEVVLLIVPMFHANGWGTPYSGPLAGVKLVLPGMKLDGESIYALMRDEQVTVSQGVPTVWLMLFDYLERNPEADLRKLALKRVGSGGSALPRHILERFEDAGIECLQGWGMTETSPMGTVGRLRPEHKALPREEQMRIKLKQGRGIWGVEVKLVADDGSEAPRDGCTPGHLHVRGPWIAAAYFKGGKSVLDADGFFPTGDIATMDERGYLQLVDRAKDMIKSGGEWISSIDLENAAAGHPGIAEAAVIGVAHPKWQERPLLIAVAKKDAGLTREALLDWLGARMAKWWLPDDVIFVAELPHTATGKLNKLKLREQYRDHLANA
jgi:fatty-acyl-CoA synthase